MERLDNRRPDQLRPVVLHRRYTKYAPGSVLIELGETRVLVTATIEERTPRHVADDHGWLTAEYALLPGSTQTRASRERMRISGRTHEIQRLIGRSLRASLDFSQLGERTINIDADVLQADGGTRTASITAGYVAVVDALTWLKQAGLITEIPTLLPVAAISVGIRDGMPLLDLNYDEDMGAEVDANLVMTAQGEIIEFQATSERAPLTRTQLLGLLDLGEAGIRQLLAAQQAALEAMQDVVSVPG